MSQPEASDGITATSDSRPCPYCEVGGVSRGCEECGHTGVRVTTLLERPDGTVARVHGNQIPDGKDIEALDALMAAAVEHMDRIDSVHERVACPYCLRPVGERCVSMQKVTRRPRVLVKNPHAERLRADGIYQR
jgi:hypothetical protein